MSFLVLNLYCIGNTTDTTDCSSTAKGDGSTEQNTTKDTVEGASEALNDGLNEAIDEAIKAETEKLYEEACSIVSSNGPGTCLNTSN